MGIASVVRWNLRPVIHVYLNNVQQMVSGELAGEGLQTGFSRHGLPPQRAPLDMVYPLREHLKSVQRMVSGGYCEGSSPDTVCWTRSRNTWVIFGVFLLSQRKGRKHLKTERLAAPWVPPPEALCELFQVAERSRHRNEVFMYTENL